MTITLRQKDLENDNKSLYLDIYENGKRKFLTSMRMASASLSSFPSIYSLR